MGSDENEGLEQRRKIAGWVSFGLGFPNLLFGAFLTFGGIIAAIFLGVIAVSAYREGPPEGALGALCLMMLLILLVVLIIIALIFSVISAIFAIAMAGQSIGGYYAIKGIHYVRSITLIFIGSAVALITGVFIIANIINSEAGSLIKIGTLAFGIFELISFLGTMISGIILIGTKGSFKNHEKKRSKKKKKE